MAESQRIVNKLLISIAVNQISFSVYGNVVTGFKPVTTILTEKLVISTLFALEHPFGCHDESGRIL